MTRHDSAGREKKFRYERCDKLLFTLHESQIVTVLGGHGQRDLLRKLRERFDERVEPARLALPVDEDEVDGDARQHDADADHCKYSMPMTS